MDPQLANIFFADPRPSFYILVGLIVAVSAFFILLSLRGGEHDAI
jgi:hypothetical protein